MTKIEREKLTDIGIIRETEQVEKRETENKNKDRKSKQRTETERESKLQRQWH